MTKDKAVKTAKLVQGSNGRLIVCKVNYLIVWVTESQVHQPHLCSLCSTMPLQYVPLMLTGLKGKIKY